MISGGRADDAKLNYSVSLLDSEITLRETGVRYQSGNSRVWTNQVKKAENAINENADDIPLVEPPGRYSINSEANPFGGGSVESSVTSGFNGINDYEKE